MLTVGISTQTYRALKVTSIARFKAFTRLTRLLIKLTRVYKKIKSKLKSKNRKNKHFIKESYWEDSWVNDSLLDNLKLLLESIRVLT